MEAISLSSLNGRKYFTSSMPDVEISGSDTTSQEVVIECGGEEVFHETLWPCGGVITLVELGVLLEPYARMQLVCSVTISSGGVSSTFDILFSLCDVGVGAEDFYNSHFLTILDGVKITGMGRREVLWYYGSGSASVSATYGDGSSASYSVSVIGGGASYTCIDVSPDNYAVAGKELVSYTVTSGNRVQRFEVDLSTPDCAPILEFYNSFGVWELIYCTGTHHVSPDYKRSSVRIGGMLKNYRIEETRLFKADTGILNTAMANWADDLFRSDKVYVVNVIGGQVVSESGGKEVVITDSKSERSNDDDHLPRFTFSYQYAQRIHNVLQRDRVGRIFDNTFDHTFN
ncbi:MAG: hypothetical protein IKH86_03135 [Prevotella sp.]|nr:hypothetical protein [Prevotella sp.]